MSLNDISTKATALREQVLGLDSHAPTPVVQIAKQLGYTVLSFEPTAETKDISGAVDHNEKTILVNGSEPAARRRFTIAHEIGHIVLHGDDQHYLDFRHQTEYSVEDKPRERDANRFAVALLMPEAVFRSHWNALKGNVTSVAERLLVSRTAAEIRAESLGLV